MRIAHIGKLEPEERTDKEQFKLEIRCEKQQALRIMSKLGLNQPIKLNSDYDRTIMLEKEE